MCNVYCRELKGWCKSFTRTEGLLSILEAILLAVFIGFLVFLILHLVACRKLQETSKEKSPDILPPIIVPPFNTSPTPSDTSTVPPDVECTWEPSKQTSAATRYYLSDRKRILESSLGTSTPPTTVYDKFTTERSLEVFEETVAPAQIYDDDEFLEPMDGEMAEDKYKSQVVALVKLKTPGDPTFGCILTKITRFWTLTAASCIESIEEMDSLDSFVVLEDYGEERESRPRTVADVRVHPLYQGANRSHDLAALRTHRALRAAPPLRLPHILDFFLIAVGERFHILGYGGYRTVEKSGAARRLRQVSVFVVSRAQCGPAGRAPGWAPRHLRPGGARPAGACGAGCAGPLCAGARAERAAPCNYCAGAPLLRGDTLIGVMSDNTACAVACEPQLYVNVAALRDWIDTLIQ